MLIKEMETVLSFSYYIFIMSLDPCLSKEVYELSYLFGLLDFDFRFSLAREMIWKISWSPLVLVALDICYLEDRLIT